MASKRKFPIDNDENFQEMHVSNKKHTLDSDEEDSDDYEKDNLQDSDIEGEEDGTAKVQDEVKITPFNMREELEEGHFDKEGHYHWNKEAEIKDNWLDNIDWVKVETDKNYLNPEKNENSKDSLDIETYNEQQAYTEVFSYMEPKETIQRTLQRLGKTRIKLSTVERLRRKKEGIVDDSGEKIIQFTELVNKILTKTGNMDVYQETYEEIKKKLSNCPSTSKAASSKPADSFDMYADDFSEKEQQLLKEKENGEDSLEEEVPKEKPPLMWEFKWKQDDEQLHGPYKTEQMQKWAEEKYFKEGVYVRKVGETSKFYSSSRVDFDLYL